MSTPAHHKEIAKHLASKFSGDPKVYIHRDDRGQRPVAVGYFGSARDRFYSTIGVCDRRLQIPEGRFELAATGKPEWLPNALVSSIYWLKDRMIDDWPMVCEDVIRQNAKSTYRHMAFVPSSYELPVAEGAPVRWLMGVPLKDSEITVGIEDLKQRIAGIYPEWLTE